MLNFGTMSLAAKVKLKMKLHVDCEFLFMNNINKNWLRSKAMAKANETNEKKMARSSFSQSEWKKIEEEKRSQSQKLNYESCEMNTKTEHGITKVEIGEDFFEFFFSSLHSNRNETLLQKEIR